MRIKEITVLINLLACFVIGNGQTAVQVTDRTLAGLKGPVRTVIVERTSATGSIREEMVTFDTGGRMIERLNYDSKGIFESRNLYKYDQKDLLLEEEKYDSNDIVLGKRVHSVDAGGKRTTSVNYDNGGKTLAETTYTYDASGNLVNEKTKKSFSFEDWIITYSYNSQGEVTGKTLTGGSLIRTSTTYEYTDGKLSKESYTDPAQLVAIRYDSRGDKTDRSRRFLLKNYSDEKYTYVYDDRENWIKQIVNKEEHTVPDNVGGMRRDDTGAVRLIVPEKVRSSEVRQRIITYY